MRVALSPPIVDLPPELALVTNLSDRGKSKRILLSGLGYLAATTILPWPILLAGFALICLWELVLSHIIWERIVQVGDDPDGSRRLLLAAMGPMLLGATLFAILPTVLASTGQPIGIALSCVWVALTAMHVYIYHSRNTLVQWATLTPVMIGASGGFLWAFGFGLESLICILALVLALAGASAHAIDRNKLLDEIAEEKAARQAAEAAAKAKARFIGTMSHELRTPLNAVIGYAEIICDEIDDGAMPQRADAGRIIAAGQHLLGLINEVLDLSRLDAGKMPLRDDVVDVSALLVSVGEMLKPMADKNANRIVVEPPSMPVVAMLDRQRLMQGLLNLGSNACKFTRGGEVTMRLSTRSADDAVELVFTVADTGCGIAADDLARLFQPFEQVHNDVGRLHDGAGLGLVITRKLARMMAGDVTVESTPGVGSVFTMTVRGRAIAMQRAA